MDHSSPNGTLTPYSLIKRTMNAAGIRAKRKRARLRERPEDGAAGRPAEMDGGGSSIVVDSTSVSLAILVPSGAAISDSSRDAGFGLVVAGIYGILFTTGIYAS